MSAVRLLVGGLVFAFLVWLLFVVVGGPPLRDQSDQATAACAAHDADRCTRRRTRP